MGKCKIGLIGLLSQLCMLSCRILNSNILDEQENNLELSNEEGLTTVSVIPSETRRDKRESNPDTEYDYDYDDTEDNPDFDEMFPELDGAEVDFAPMPQKLVLNLNVYLDKDWYTAFNLAGNIIATFILKQASLLLAHDSLTTKIELVYHSNKFYNSSQHLVPSRKAFNELLPQELIGPDYDDEGHPTAHLYLSAGPKSKILGIAEIYGMCTNSTKQKPRIMVHVLEDHIRTAMTVAHEIGHLLGMEHDFKLGKRGRTCGKGEKSGEFVMNYGSKRQSFSDCANEDFKDYYKRVVAKNDKFCLAHGVAGCSCHGNKDTVGLGGKCTNGRNSAYLDWCYVHHDSGCDDLTEYHGQPISYLACKANNTKTATTDEMPKPGLPCACNGKSDILGFGGSCQNGPNGAWCYVDAKGGCANNEPYNGNFISLSPCNGRATTHCSWGEWSSWSSCSATCGGGNQIATRSIEQQATGGGEQCRGSKKRSQECGRAYCPTDCSWGQWSSWSSCSATCGGGTQTATRSIKQQATGGGEQCRGYEKMSQECGRTDCPTDCVWGDWSSWSSCSVTCGRGTKYATRYVTQQATAGGELCTGSNRYTDTCDTDSCDFLDFYDVGTCLFGFCAGVNIG